MEHKHIGITRARVLIGARAFYNNHNQTGERVFFRKKEPKNFYPFESSAAAPPALISKSFLLLFCKKEGLP
jgi:hypothetical protein